jgi:hypothetical protein
MGRLGPSPTATATGEAVVARIGVPEVVTHGLGHFTKDNLLQQATQVDPGFDQRILAQMLRSTTRFSDQDPPTPKRASQH